MFLSSFLIFLILFKFTPLGFGGGLFGFYFAALLTCCQYNSNNNILSFLFTLPITKKQYIKSTYIFSFIGFIVCLSLFCVYLLIYTKITGNFNAYQIFRVVTILLLLFDLPIFNIPLLLKYEFKKTAISLFVILFFSVSLLVGLYFFIKSFLTSAVFLPFHVTHEIVYITTLFVLLILLFIKTLFAYKISLKIISKKEF